MRLLLTAFAVASLAVAPAANAAQCKDAKGRFMKCAPAAPAKPVRCKLNGKFAKCGTPGAKPI